MEQNALQQENEKVSKRFSEDVIDEKTGEPIIDKKTGKPLKQPLKWEVTAIRSEEDGSYVKIIQNECLCQGKKAY